MNKKISLKTKNLIGSIFAGIFFALSGIFDMFDNIPFQIVSGLFMMLAGASLIFILFIKAEEGDEMSEAHSLKAKAQTYNTILCGIIIIALISVISRMIFHKDFIVDWHAWLLVFIGIMQFMYGYYFAKYERDGD